MYRQINSLRTKHLVGSNIKVAYVVVILGSWRTCSSMLRGLGNFNTVKYLLSFNIFEVELKLQSLGG